MYADSFSPTSRIPVWPVVERSYLYLWEYRGLFALPVLTLFAVVFVINAVSGVYSAGIPAPPGHLLTSNLATIAIGLVSIAFIVGVHRTVLLDERYGGLGFFRIDGNFARYFWTMLLFFLLMILVELGVGIIVALVAGIGALVAKLLGGAAGTGAIMVIVVVGVGVVIIGIIAIALRLSLALPAAAVGDQKRFSLSWNATKGNTARLFAIFVLTELPFIILALFYMAPYLGDVISAVQTHQHPRPFHPGLIVQLLMAAVRALSLPILTTQLSLIYDILVRGGGPAETAR